MKTGFPDSESLFFCDEICRTAVKQLSDHVPLIEINGARRLLFSALRLERSPFIPTLRPLTIVTLIQKNQKNSSKRLRGIDGLALPFIGKGNGSCKDPDNHGDRNYWFKNKKRDKRFACLFFQIGAEGGTRTRTDCSTRPSNVRGYQLRHLSKLVKNYRTTSSCRLSSALLSSLPASPRLCSRPVRYLPEQPPER